MSGCTVLEDITTSEKLIPTELRCEYARDPLGVDVANPRLFWKLESSVRSQRQSAYQIIVASSLKNLTQDKGDLWDSGNVVSDKTIQIFYDGLPLKSSQQIFWKVHVWDKDDNVSKWSRPATWTIGILNEADWKARWISAEQENQTLMLRREFTVKAGLKHAVAHVCGLGHYEMFLNGKKVGDDILSPGWSKYNKTCLYNTRELTQLLKEGDNAVGLLLGNGMYNVKGGRYVKFKGSFGPLKAVCQIRLEYEDGTTEIIGTDRNWFVKAGPITFSCVFGGEDYDARLEPAGWKKPGFDNLGWTKAQELEGPGGELKGLCYAAPPIRTFDILKPVSINQLRPGVDVYDLGQNAALMPRLKTKGPAGSIVRIIPAELLKDDGSVDRNSCARGRPGYWQYTLAGKGSEEWFPKFFYQGCRYLQVERMPAPASGDVSRGGGPAQEGGELPVVENLEGVVVHSSSDPVGRFECSNDLFNRIHELVRWAQRSNMMSVMTDCPHREKLGWLEQYHLNGPSLRYEFDLARLFTKGMNDMADSQLDDGLVPNIAPEYVVFDGGFRDSPEWSSAFLLVPWQQYLWDVDLELIRNYYEDMKRYVAYLGSKATDDIVSHGLGDWYDIGPRVPGRAQLTPVPLTATAFYYYDTTILSKMAKLLDKAGEAEEYAKRAAEIRDAFNREFYNPATGQYATGSQCSNAVPLVMGLVEPANRQAVLDAIVQDVQERGNALTAGDVGYRYLLRALAEGGRSDVIYAMNNQSEKPGYGYQLKMGATSLTEAWNARRSSSQNHFMLGQIIEWFYHDLAGIGTDPTGPGFKKIIIKPQPVGDLSYVKASYNSIRGEIISDWKRKGDSFILKIKIPANTTATVYVPAKPETKVTESGAPAGKGPGVKFLRYENGCSLYEIGSGEYEFQSRL